MTVPAKPKVKEAPTPQTPEEKAKLIAETAKLEAERLLTVAQLAQTELEIAQSKAIVQVERRQAEAELEAAKAEAQRAWVEARSTQAIVDEQVKQELMRTEQLHMMVTEQKVGLDALQRKEKEYLAHETHFHVYTFDKEVSDSSVKACMSKMNEWSRNNPECDIELVLNSPGGDVIAGLALWDYLKMLQRRGHKITTVALGMAASMAAILVQAGDVRAMGKESYLMIHEISAGTMGKIGELDDDLKFYHHVMERILDIFAARSVLTKAQLRKRWERKDWYIDSDSALALKLVDEIR